jgi:hypothetical protein
MPFRSTWVHPDFFVFCVVFCWSLFVFMYNNPIYKYTNSKCHVYSQYIMRGLRKFENQIVISMQLFQDWIYVCTNEYDKYICISYIIWQYMLAFYPANENTPVLDKILTNTRILETKRDMTTSLSYSHISNRKSDLKC